MTTISESRKSTEGKQQSRPQATRYQSRTGMATPDFAARFPARKRIGTKQKRDP